MMRWKSKGVVVKDSRLLTREQREMISEVKKLVDGTVVVKLHNPNPMLRLLGEYMELFTDESAEPPAVLNVSESRLLVFVDAPPPEILEEW